MVAPVRTTRPAIRALIHELLVEGPVVSRLVRTNESSAAMVPVTVRSELDQRRGSHTVEANVHVS